MKCGNLLLVIPPVVLEKGENFEVDVDFANNLILYLKNFEKVTVACPALNSNNNSGLQNTVPFESLQGAERVFYIPLPYTYREDRHLVHYHSIRKMLISEINKADYLLFSPHAMFDWSTLAAKLAVSMGRSYDMEADWFIESVSRLDLSKMPFGLKKLRKFVWMKYYGNAYRYCLINSDVSLLQGRDVFDAYRNIAPNPFKVLNVQITKKDILSSEGVENKISKVKKKEPITISYAGRVIDMKGPFDWLRVIEQLIKRRVRLKATWFGDGELLPALRAEAKRLKIDNYVTFPGIVEREVVMAAQRHSDIFLFCHKAAESPRCLVEALACACPIVGYGGSYARDLVESEGGGAFVDVGDWQGLADLVCELDRNRDQLVDLIRYANASAQLYDRDKAMQYRIDLIKKYVQRPDRSVGADV